MIPIINHRQLGFDPGFGSGGVLPPPSQPTITTPPLPFSELVLFGFQVYDLSEQGTTPFQPRVSHHATANSPRHQNSCGAPWPPSPTPRGGLGRPTPQERPSLASSRPPTTPSRSVSNPQRRGQATESARRPRAANLRAVQNKHRVGRANR